MSPAVKRYRKLQKVKTQPNLARNVQEMDNNTLVTVASMSNHEATIEVLKRHIMMVDKVPYEEAEKTFDKIQKVNNQRKWLAALPYQFGIVTATGTAMASIPMVFGLNTATWFNHNFVTIEVPDAADLETALEVGSWSWSWMEPPLGTLSFFLLCLQFSRAQMKNLGIRPFTASLKQTRARKLHKAFPQYDPAILSDFSTTAPLA